MQNATKDCRKSQKTFNTSPHVWHTPNTRITEIGNARTNIAVEKIEHAPARVAYAKHADYGNRERENNFPRKEGTAGGCKKQPEVALGCKGSARGSTEQQGVAKGCTEQQGAARAAARSSKGCKEQQGAARAAARSSKGCTEQQGAARAARGCSKELQGAARAARSSKGQQGLHGAARTAMVNSGLDQMKVEAQSDNEFRRRQSRRRRRKQRRLFKN